MLIIQSEIGSAVVNLLDVEVVLLPRSNQQTPPCPRLRGQAAGIPPSIIGGSPWNCSMSIGYPENQKQQIVLVCSIPQHTSRYCIFHQCHVIPACIFLNHIMSSKYTRNTEMPLPKYKYTSHTCNLLLLSN